jgi:hydroxymethylpyrimidine pyrophosphatase-like HAD family hydrolase
MLKCVGTGVAIGNTSEEVKYAADFVTKHVDEDVIFYSFKHSGLI